MPAAIEASVKRKVIQQWLSGDSRPKIAIDNNIGEGTVGSIVADFKIGLDNSEFDAAREVALQAKKQGLNLSILASHFRLHNYFRSSGASENAIESFIIKVSSGDVSPEKVIELVYQLDEISDAESIALDQLSGYIKEKLQEKQKIDEEIKQANGVLQSKNVNIETLNEYIRLSEKLNEYNLSIQDIDKLLKILVNAGRYGFDGKRIASKLYDIQDLERKERGLKNKYKELSKQAVKYKDILPLTEEIAAWQIGVDELMALKVGINQVAKFYNLPFVSATTPN
jgi:hypothetical protein